MSHAPQGFVPFCQLQPQNGVGTLQRKPAVDEHISVLVKSNIQQNNVRGSIWFQHGLILYALSPAILFTGRRCLLDWVTPSSIQIELLEYARPKFVPVPWGLLSVSWRPAAIRSDKGNLSLPRKACVPRTFVLPPQLLANECEEASRRALSEYYALL